MRNKKGLSIAGLIVAVSILAGNLSICFFDLIPGLTIGSPASPEHSPIFKGLALALIAAAIFNLLISLRDLHPAKTERDLQALEKRLRFTDFSIENVTDAVYWTTMEHRIVNVNLSACKMLGYSREELLSMTTLDIDPDYANEDVEGELEKLRRMGSVRLNRFHTTKDGCKIPVEVTATYFKYNDREYFCGIVRDITDRIEAEKEASFFRTLIEYTSDPVYALDVEDGYRMCYVNKPACSHFGMSREQLLTLRIPDWDPVFMNADPSLLLFEYGKCFSFETVHRVASGALVPVEVTANYLEHDGRKISAGYFHNISERKSMDAALKESERNLIEAQRIAHLGNWVRDLSGNIQSASAECRRVVGLTQTEFGKPFESFLKLVSAYDRERVRTAFESLLKDHKPYSLEYRLVDTDSTEKVIHEHGEVAFDDREKPVRLVGTVQDVTDSKLLSARLDQAQKMQAIGTLAGGIAHDFNNILAPIIGYAELSLISVPKDGKLNHNMSQVLLCANRAKDLVRQILTFSRMDREEQKPVQVSLVMEEALKLIRSTLPSTIDIRQAVTSNAIESTTMADPTRIHQVLMNLCTNAAHAMRQSGGTLTVALENVEIGPDPGEAFTDLEPGAYIRMSVADTGHGIDESVRRRIFEPYYTTKGTNEGTGLGLAVVYGIVKNMSGTINVFSKPDEGTTFDVYLRRADIIPAPPTAASGPLPTGHGRILVVDDEKFIVDMLSEMLQTLGYEVVPRYSSIDALETFRTAPESYNAIITDMTMPHMTGIDLTMEILMIRADTPIVLCTGFSDDIDENRAKALGIKAFLMKPVALRDLAMVVSKNLIQDAGRRHSESTLS